jgi:hypothetical protein
MNEEICDFRFAICDLKGRISTTFDGARLELHQEFWRSALLDQIANRKSKIKNE